MNATDHDEHRFTTLLDRLRALAPTRPITLTDALNAAEAQADALRAEANREPMRPPDDLITALPGVRVELSPHAPAAGSAYRDNHTGLWVLAIRDELPEARTRVCLLYAFKYVLDHTAEEDLYGSDQILADAYQHAAADLFATRVVAHPHAIDLVINAGTNSVDGIARVFGLDTDTTRRHLTHLGHLDQDGNIRPVHMAPSANATDGGPR